MLPDVSPLKLVVDGGIAYLELDHGKANEMGRAEVCAFERLVIWLEGGNARALVTYSRRVTARGSSVFISGVNVTERAAWSTQEVKSHVRYQRITLARLPHCIAYLHP